MARVEPNTPAPGFTLSDWTGKPVSLADFINLNSVLVVFNRGFL